MPKKENGTVEAVETPEVPEASATTSGIAEAEARIAAMLADAEERARRIIEAAEGKAGDLQGGGMAAPPSPQDKELEEYVEIKLFKDNDRYQDDVFVAVNGESCLIKRGIPVKIKKKFARVLDESGYQDAKTAMLIDSKSREFEAESRARGL